MTFIQCEVELRRTDGRLLSTSVSLQVRPAVDQPINVPIDDGPWVKAKIASLRPLNVRNTVFEVTAVLRRADRADDARQHARARRACLDDVPFRAFN
jgi:hypothetical protein